MADEHTLFSLLKRVYHKKRLFHIHLHIKRDYLGNGWLISLHPVGIADRHGTKIEMESSPRADIIWEVVFHMQQRRTLPLSSFRHIMKVQGL